MIDQALKWLSCLVDLLQVQAVLPAAARPAVAVPPQLIKAAEMICKVNKLVSNLS